MKKHWKMLSFYYRLCEKTFWTFCHLGSIIGPGSVLHRAILSIIREPFHIVRAAWCDLNRWNVRTRAVRVHDHVRVERFFFSHAALHRRTNVNVIIFTCFSQPRNVVGANKYEIYVNVSGGPLFRSTDCSLPSGDYHCLPVIHPDIRNPDIICSYSQWLNTIVISSIPC